MNPNNIDTEAALQAQNELAQKQYQSRLDALYKKARQAAQNKGESAKRILCNVLGQQPDPVVMDPKKKSQTFSFRIEGFRRDNDDKAEVYSAILEGSGENVIAATINAVKKLESGEAQFKRL